MSTDKRRNLRDMLDELDHYFDEFEKDIQEIMRGSMSSAEVSKPFMAGFSFKLGPEGRPSFQIFGDSLTGKDGYRSPLTEQFLDEKGGRLNLVVDMPGVEKDEIKVDATDESAIVTAENESRRYRAEVGLKARVDPDSGKAEYRNGVLDISFSLKDKDNKGFKRVDIV
ncbi:MAG TPA: Hsp20 family protein [Nitrososphaerales archaeon]|nr:Hsp20 family protein [Nitrososphaerales archaeon]